MEITNNVYIAATATITAPLYSTQEIIDILYPRQKVAKKVYKMAMRLRNYVDIQNRSMVIDPSLFPTKQLCSLENSAKNWGMRLLDLVSGSINRSDIGCITVAYNVKSHKNLLPNLAC